MFRKAIYKTANCTLTLEARLRLVKKVLKSDADKNIPLVYRDRRCKHLNEFIHEYPDGRKFLIRQSFYNSNETVLRKLK